MFRLRKAGIGQVVLTLSGRIEVEDLAEIQGQLAQETGMGAVVLDLKNVTLVNDSVVEFLVRCQGTNVSLRRCPGYIRKWMEQVKGAKMSMKR
jgi:anti-anti-sigma regulatory factor